MPYASRKVSGKRNCYRVYNKTSKRVFAKCATRKHAKQQMKLLRALQYNKKFIPYSKNRKTMKKLNKSYKNM